MSNLFTSLVNFTKLLRINQLSKGGDSEYKGRTQQRLFSSLRFVICAGRDKNKSLCLMHLIFFNTIHHTLLKGY